MDPYQRLAAHILRQAKDDWKKTLRRINKCGRNSEQAIALNDIDQLSLEAAQMRTLQITHSQLLDFYEGDWCDALCDFVGKNREVLLDKLRGRKIEAKRN